MVAGIPCVREFSFDIDSTALLVVDMQNCFFDEKHDQVYLPSFDAIIPNINKLIEVFESKNRPLLFI